MGQIARVELCYLAYKNQCVQKSTSGFIEEIKKKIRKMT